MYLNEHWIDTQQIRRNVNSDSDNPGLKQRARDTKSCKHWRLAGTVLHTAAPYLHELMRGAILNPYLCAARLEAGFAEYLSLPQFPLPHSSMCG